MTASKVLAIEQAFIGTKETPVNDVLFNTWYYGHRVNGYAYPWCMVFQQYCFNEAGEPLPIKTASCTTLMNWAKKNGRWITQDYKPGDVFIVQTSSGKHTGMVEKVYTNGVDTVEGNLDDQVRHNYRRIETLIGAYRHPFEEEDMTPEEVKKIVMETIAEEEAKRSAAPPSAWSADDRQWAEKNGIVYGDPTGFHYKDPCTREQMTSFLHRLFNLLR